MVQRNNSGQKSSDSKNKEQKQCGDDDRSDKYNHCDDEDDDGQIESQSCHDDEEEEEENVMEMVMSEKVNAMHRGKSIEFDREFGAAKSTDDHAPALSSSTSNDANNGNTRLDLSVSQPELIIDDHRRSNNSGNSSSTTSTSISRRRISVRKSTPGAFRVQSILYSHNHNNESVDDIDHFSTAVNDVNNDDIVIIPHASLVTSTEPGGVDETSTRTVTSNRMHKNSINEDLENPISLLIAQSNQKMYEPPPVIAEVVVNESAVDGDGTGRATTSSSNPKNVITVQNKQQRQRRRRIFGCIIMVLLIMIVACLIAILVQMKNKNNKIRGSHDSAEKYFDKNMNYESPRPQNKSSTQQPDESDFIFDRMDGN